MKTIGIIGGLPWPSTTAYYQRINQLVAQKLGPFHCAKLVLVQTDFDAIKKAAAGDQWDDIGKLLVSSAKQLEDAGADFIVIACNTVHMVLPAVQHEIRLPVLHIVDVTAEKVKRCGFKTVGLLGTVYTMKDDYFSGRLRDNYGITVLLPAPGKTVLIQHAAEQEVATGVLPEDGRATFRQVIDELVTQGCEAIILGCTDFERYLHAGDLPVPLIDTAAEHVEATVAMAFAE
ncbi:hypothetical protein K4F52_006727 [Lecanicillium sp. MT-2017a]|nr:hypothetical protein K4F52_006727 [Lecanicillium sp. MT-2017a]